MLVKSIPTLLTHSQGWKLGKNCSGDGNKTFGVASFKEKCFQRTFCMTSLWRWKVENYFQRLPIFSLSSCFKINIWSLWVNEDLRATNILLGATYIYITVFFQSTLATSFALVWLYDIISNMTRERLHTYLHKISVLIIFIFKFCIIRLHFFF